mgnify:CR=1 FL=1
MNRKSIKAKLSSDIEYDVLVIGGGATGLGVALDAVSRGCKVALVEKVDFGKGTSSKATKLLHGGVRYLQNGDVALVIEALKEREFVLENAPHLSRIQKFIIPYYTTWRGWYYLAGLKTYDLLSGKRSLGSTKKLNKEETLAALPNIKSEGLKGGIEYTDGQFDDTRLCIDLVSTINKMGGAVLNYIELDSFSYDQRGKICGGMVTDLLDDTTFLIKAKSVVNATGVFAEQTMAIESEDTDIKIVPARGSHIVLDRKFLQSDHAIMIPKTSDGRVLFLVPWHNVVIVGTTDVVSPEMTLEPEATDEEITFILANAKKYLSMKPTRADILSTFAGLRPLAAPKKEGKKSKEISRSHKIVSSKGGLVSVLGGKWTTFRKMGEDTVDSIIKKKILPSTLSTSGQVAIYNGTIPSVGETIHPKLPYTWAQLEHYAREELVETVEDLLCRRSRCIILHKQATLDILEQAIDLLASVKGKNEVWKGRQRWDFTDLAKAY